jgi:hypothetical protein
MNEIYTIAMLSAVRAFLGRIDHDVRAISITIDSKNVSVTVYYNHKVNQENIELIDEAETEIMADISEECIVSIKYIYLEPSLKIPYIFDQSFIFLRKGEEIEQVGNQV